MTPKEKARDLVNKFCNECLLTTDGGLVAACIAVEEILNHHSQEQGLYRIDRYYWEEVKNELNKQDTYEKHSNRWSRIYTCN